MSNIGVTVFLGRKTRPEETPSLNRREIETPTQLTRAMRVCDTCEDRKSEGTRLVSRNGGDMWVCHGCMMQAVTNKADELSYRDW